MELHGLGRVLRSGLFRLSSAQPKTVREKTFHVKQRQKDSLAHMSAGSESNEIEEGTSWVCCQLATATLVHPPPQQISRYPIITHLLLMFSPSLPYTSLALRQALLQSSSPTAYGPSSHGWWQITIRKVWIQTNSILLWKKTIHNAQSLVWFLTLLHTSRNMTIL